MKAVILAAGTGSRLVNLTRDLPKALVEVHGHPLIEYTLRFADRLECEAIAVGGFYFEKLQDYIKEHWPNVSLIENGDFLKGSILSLQSALPRVDDSFVLTNVDHLYPIRLAERFLQRRQTFEHVTAFVDFDRPLQDDDMKVLLSEGNTIKTISKRIHEFDAGYIGLTYVPKRDLETYKRAAGEIAQKNEEAAVESVLQWMANNGAAPHVFDVSGIRWLEVDNQWDLRNAERILSRVTDFLD